MAFNQGLFDNIDIEKIDFSDLDNLLEINNADNLFFQEQDDYTSDSEAQKYKEFVAL